MSETDVGRIFFNPTDPRVRPSDLDRQLLHPGQLIPITPPQPKARMTAIDPEALHAFFELYYGMTSEESDRTGYDARVAKAIKTLKPFFEKHEAKAAT